MGEMEEPGQEPLEPERVGALAAGRQRFENAYARADRALDRQQQRVFRLLWFFLPDASVVRNPRLEQVLASRFFSDAGQQALTYGALIAVVRGGGTAFESALIGVAALVPPAAFGLYGGAVADQIPKRVALGLIYNLQAALCLVVPFVFGTDLWSVFFLIFGVHTLGQISGPSESSVVPLVANEEQLASAASLVSFASNLGTAFGTALLAPILVRLLGEEAVFVVAGLMLFVAASRVFDLPVWDSEPRMRKFVRPRVDVRATVRWLAHERAVATMIFVAVLAGTASIVIQTLAPRYVQSVLGVDAADAVYVFAPTSIGLIAAMLATPILVRLIGERPVALAGFITVTVVLLGLGLIDQTADLIDDLNPLRLMGIAKIDVSRELRTAAILAIPLGFGLALTQISVQTYINRRVPLPYQGRTFALQSVVKNGATIGPLLTLGAAATVFGVQAVLVLSPFLLLFAAFGLVRLSQRFAGEAPTRRLDVLASYWEESNVPVTTPDHAREIDTAGSSV